MEKELKRLIRILKAEYALMWVLTVLLAALYECDILPQGLFAGDAHTICLIPLSLRLFNLSLTRHIAALPLKNALKSYRRWSEIRIALLTVASLASLSAYYWTMDTTGLLCTGMTVIASLFCVPGKERLLSELNLSDTSLSE